MTQEKQDKIIEKGLGLSIISYLLLQQAGRLLKQDGKYYKGSTKRHLNLLLQDSLPILMNIDKLKNLLVSKEVIERVEKKTGNELEAEVLESQLTTEQELFTKFLSLYIRSGEAGMYQLEMVLDNLLEKKPLFTQEAVLDIIHKYNARINPTINFEEEYLLKEFIL